MGLLELTSLVLVLSSLAYFAGIKKISRFPTGERKLHTKPSYFAWYLALWSGVPAILFAASLMLAGGDDAAVFNGPVPPFLLTIGILTTGFAWGWRHLHPRHNARKSIERFIRALLLICSTIAILTTIGIIMSILFEALRFFRLYPVGEFLFGLQWSPQTAIREDQVGGSGAFGFVPLFAGTLMISLIAMLLAAPIGFLSAIFFGEYAPPAIRTVAKPLLEILAGIPTVVYGFFAALWVAPIIRESAAALGMEASSESALAAGLVMGIMLIPFISSLTDDVINAVPVSLRDSSYALGATKSETITRVVLPAALPGIISSLLLAISRAIGETMIVVMAAGLAAKLSANPLDAMTTVTVQITSLLVGDQEFDSAKTLASFALGLSLFVSTLALNITALIIVRRYREVYE